MKLFGLFFLLIGLHFSGRGNVYVPFAELAGESVYVRVQKESAAVTAVFEFKEWDTRDQKIVYLPIYAGGEIEPTQLLALAGVELEIQGKKVGMVAPCKPPEKFKKLLGTPHLHWFSVSLDQMPDGEVDPNQPFAVRLSYAQPLINGRFYYLPVIPGESLSDERSWHYQMTVHSGSRVLRVRSKDIDYERAGDGITVFLKNGKVVEIE